MPTLLWLMHVAPIGTSVTLLFQMSSDVFSWLKDIGLALTWKIYHDMFGHFLDSLSISQPQGQWKLWLQGSKHQSPGLPTVRYGTCKEDCIPHCAHAATSSLLPPPPMTISVSTYPFSSTSLSPANFLISFKHFPSAFLTFLPFTL